MKTAGRDNQVSREQKRLDVISSFTENVSFIMFGDHHENKDFSEFW